MLGCCYRFENWCCSEGDWALEFNEYLEYNYSIKTPPRIFFALTKPFQPQPQLLSPLSLIIIISICLPWHQIV